MHSGVESRYDEVRSFLAKYHHELKACSIALAKRFPLLAAEDIAQQGAMRLLKSGLPEDSNFSNKTDRARFFSTLLRRSAIRLVQNNRKSMEHAPHNLSEIDYDTIPAKNRTIHSHDEIDFFHRLRELSKEDQRTILVYLREGTSTGVGRALHSNPLHVSEDVLRMNGTRRLKRAVERYFRGKSARKVV